MDGDEVVQLYVKQPAASVPVPQVRLADFARVRIAAGSSVSVSLVLLAKYRFVVPNTATMWDPQSLVEAGPVSISVGGGQPDFYKGSLQATVTVADSATLDACGQQ
jgi:beta-glucosidase